MRDDDRRPTRAPLFERWHVEIAPLSERPTDASEWADALVLVEQGTVDVVCRAGADRCFGPGSLIALCWLPVSLLRNPTTELTRLLAFRRRAAPPTEERGLPSKPS